MASSSELSYEPTDGVGWITIERPERRNALSAEAIAAFMEALKAAEADDDVHVLCVTGGGDKVFCSGADLMSAFTGGDVRGGMQAYADLLKRLHRFPKPSVARVAGHCLAGGLGLLLACDIALGRDDGRYWTPELDVGVFPMMIGALIFRNVPRKKAMEMIFTGRKYSAAEAADMGLISRAVPEETFEQEVADTLANIARKAPVALKMGREALATAEELALGPALDHLCDKLAALAQTEDAAEGMMAFMQKRKPEWKGR
jgi:enoyl-CoA hydratase/carnithine racemase